MSLISGNWEDLFSLNSDRGRVNSGNVLSNILVVQLVISCFGDAWKCPCLLLNESRMQ